MTMMRPPIRDLLNSLRSREDYMLRVLKQFVQCESPSHDKPAVDRMGRLVANEWRRRVARVSVLKQATRGNHVRAELRPGGGHAAGQILILGHLDTVYPLGSIGKMRYRVKGGAVWGPGTFDMKGGLVLALAAVDALRARGIHPEKRLVFLWTSDEEIGSESSRTLIEREARRSDAVLVLEPPFGAEGRLKTARKGVGSAIIVVTGRSAHAGIEPEKGVNAIHEIALQISQVMKLNDPRRGVTVQATVVDGGTVSNVVPAQARAKLDLRYQRMVDAHALERKLRSLRPILRGARVEVNILPSRPPLERTTGVLSLFRQARQIAGEMGIALGEAATGGGSDGNFTAALGVPTLDGLGAVGDGAHSPQEHVVVRALAERAALLAGLLATL
jgi:glutamate carboxypeptidase